MWPYQLQRYGNRYWTAWVVLMPDGRPDLWLFDTRAAARRHAEYRQAPASCIQRWFVVPDEAGDRWYATDGSTLYGQSWNGPTADRAGCELAVEYLALNHDIRGLRPLRVSLTPERPLPRIHQYTLFDVDSNEPPRPRRQARLYQPHTHIIDPTPAPETAMADRSRRAAAAVNAAAAAGCSAEATDVYLAIALAEFDAPCRLPTIAAIAGHARLGRRATRGAVEELEQIGLIGIDRSSTGRICQIFDKHLRNGANQ